MNFFATLAYSKSLSSTGLVLSIVLLLHAQHALSAQTAPVNIQTPQLDLQAPQINVDVFELAANADSTDGPGDGSRGGLTDAVGNIPKSQTNDKSIQESTAGSNFSLSAKPRWEAGIGGGLINGFDYPASTDPNKVRLGLPFFIYRGARLRFGSGGGVGAVAVEEPRVKLDLSLGGSLNAKSEGNRAREGLPDLDFLFEIGPRLQVRLLDQQWGTAGRGRLTWDTKLRAVFATDFKGINTQGTVFVTGLGYAQRSLLELPVDLLARFNVTFADKRLQEYLYSVPVQFANANRAQYDAKGGYLSSSVSLGFAFRPRAGLRIFTAVVYGQFANAANESSPLFETKQSIGVALGLVWTLFSSKKMQRIYDAD